MDQSIPRAVSFSSGGGAGSSAANAATSAADPNRITSFPEAIAALKQHVFPPTGDLGPATRAARELHDRTALTLDTEDVFQLLDAKNQLDPSTHYLAFVSVLHALLAQLEPGSALLPHVLPDYRALVARTPPALAQAAPERWVGAARHAARLAVQARDIPAALSLVQPLRTAAEKLAPAADYLVPPQADFLAVCLEAKCYRLAARWLREQRRLQVDVVRTGLTASDVHLIYHYAALVFVGVKDFRAALQSCRLALSVPAPAPGSFFNVAMSTYKTFILLHLLVTGKAPPSLKFSSYQLARMRKMSSEYMELARAYEQHDRVQMEKIIESNREQFEKQAHLGLVKQVTSALSKQLIIDLTNSFVTMRMTDVTTRVGLANPEEAQAVILEMIRSNKINASIDDLKQIVRLMDNNVMEDSAVSPNLSSAYMNHCLNIVERIEAFREKLESDPVYVMKELNAQNLRRSPGSGGGAGPSGASGGVGHLEAEFLTYG